MKTTLILTAFLFLTFSCSGDDDEPTAPQVVYTQDECQKWSYEWQNDRYTTGERFFGLFAITDFKYLYPPPPPVPTDKIYTGRIENGIESYYIIKCAKK